MSSTPSDNITIDSSDTPGELIVRTVTVQHKKTTLKHHPRTQHGGGKNPSTEEESINGVNPMTMNTAQPSSSSSSSVPVIVVTKDSHEGDKEKKQRRGICGGFFPCCPPWYLLAAVLATTALAIGLGVGLGLKKEDTVTPVPIRYYNLDLKFDVVGKEVNVTLISQLRCLVANITDPTQFKRVLMTSWEESNGTTY